MKFGPVNKWIIGRVAVHKKPIQGKIIAPGDRNKKVTRCFLIEEVSEAAKAAGYAPGDIVLAHHVFDMVMHGGDFHRVTFEHTEIICRVIAPLDEFTGLDGKPVEPLAAAAE